MLKNQVNLGHLGQFKIKFSKEIISVRSERPKLYIGIVIKCRNFREKLLEASNNAVVNIVKDLLSMSENVCVILHVN